MMGGDEIDYLKELKAINNWVCYKLEPRKDGSMSKVPYNPIEHYRVSATAPDQWVSYKDAVKGVSSGRYAGIGFEFSGSEYMGIDFDHCINDSKLNRKVAEVVYRFDSYTEISQSGSGIHIICKGSIPKGRKTVFDADKGIEIEMYSDGRFFVVTENNIVNMVPEHRQQVVDAVYKEFFPDKSANAPAPDVSKTSCYISMSDREIIEGIEHRSGVGKRFSELFYGSVLYAPNVDHSRLDTELCSLIYNFIPDIDAVDRLFRMSALYRDKWKRESYRDNVFKWVTSNYTPMQFYKKAEDYTKDERREYARKKQAERDDERWNQWLK